MSRSSRCIGTGGRWKPSFSSSSRASTLSPPARGAVDRQARGLVDHDRLAVDEEDAVFKVIDAFSEPWLSNASN